MAVLDNDSLQLTIRSERILAGTDWVDGTIVVADGRIAAISTAAAAPQAARHIDARGLSIIPGLIDTHVHLRDPGFTDKEDFSAGTRAAAAGGVTTVLDMPNVKPPTTDAEKVRAHLANAAPKSYVDFGHNAAATVPDNIAAMSDAGATAFKVFMMRDVGRDYPHMPGVAIDDHATLFRICEEVAKTGKPLLMHCHDQSLYEMLVERAISQWGRDHKSYARAGRQFNGINLDSGIALMLLLQRETGVRMEILHVATIGGIEMIRAAQRAGRAVSAEVNPHGLFVNNSWQAIEERGPMVLGTWIPDDHAQALWGFVLDPSTNVIIGTDHSPHTLKEKELGWEDMYAAPGGSPIIQHYLSLFLTAVNEGRISLERVVEMTSTAPARFVNLYPRKGVIAVGSDADFVAVDLGREQTVTAQNSLYKCGWTPLEGRTVKGLPVLTVLRGEVIYEDGEVVGKPGYGRPVTASLEPAKA
jgi:dihydroorotase (multifunctional complex type)